MVNVEVRIGEVVLHGIGGHRRAAIEDALRGELALLLTERVRATPDALHAARVPSHMASLHVPRGSTDAAIGRHIARATLRAIDGASGGGNARGRSGRR